MPRMPKGIQNNRGISPWISTNPKNHLSSLLIKLRFCSKVIASLFKVIALNNYNNYPADFPAPLKTFQPVILPMTLSEINSLCRLAISTEDFDDFCKKFFYFPHLARTIVFSPTQSTFGKSSNEKTF